MTAPTDRAGLVRVMAETIIAMRDCEPAAVALAPEGWWLHHLGEVRTRTIYAGDTHDPTGKFRAELQHVNGGMLTSADAASPALALTAAKLR